MDALELCNQYYTNASKQKTTALCKKILKSTTNVALAIFKAKNEGWWNDKVHEPCSAILSFGGTSKLVYLAKEAGWWNDSVADPQQVILDSNFYDKLVIDEARKASWWKAEPKATDDLITDIESFKSKANNPVSSFEWFIVHSKDNALLNAFVCDKCGSAVLDSFPLEVTAIRCHLCRGDAKRIDTDYLIYRLMKLDNRSLAMVLNFIFNKR